MHTAKRTAERSVQFSVCVCVCAYIDHLFTIDNKCRYSTDFRCMPLYKHVQCLIEWGVRFFLTGTECKFVVKLEKEFPMSFRIISSLKSACGSISSDLQQLMFFIRLCDDNVRLQHIKNRSTLMYGQTDKFTHTPRLSAPDRHFSPLHFYMIVYTYTHRHTICRIRTQFNHNDELLRIFLERGKKASAIN